LVRPARNALSGKNGSGESYGELYSLVMLVIDLRDGLGLLQLGKQARTHCSARGSRELDRGRPKLTKKNE